MTTKTYRQHIVTLEITEGVQTVAGTFNCMCTVHEKDDDCGYHRAHALCAVLRDNYRRAFRIAVYELRSQDGGR